MLPQTTSGISRPPTAREILFDRTFRGLTFTFALATILLVVFIVYNLSSTAAPAVAQQGIRPLTGTTWAAGDQKFGLLPAIWGTIYSSFLGVALGTLFGVSVAIFLTENYLPARFNVVLKNVIELLAAIPSVVYGLWGIFVVIPWLQWALPGFTGQSMLPAALVLAIMVLPTITAISRDALGAVPMKLREAAYGLGATRWETIIGVILPTASRGIYGSVILAFGRALGETMALAMLVGNSNNLTISLFSPANTLAALLANQFPEASTSAPAGQISEVSALMYAALVLLAITLAVNVLGTLVLARTTKLEGAR
jgi:phosphate transport system permease protein